MTERRTVADIDEQYQAGEPIAMVTCYDYTFAKLVGSAGIDAVLIGDSLGNVIQGEATTLPVTLDEIVYHTRPVVRGTEQPHVVADMPFMSYQASDDEGIRNAGKILKEGGAQAVKIEGGESVAPMISRMVEAGIPVMGHLGLTPQSVRQTGGYRVQGRGEAADELIADAHALEDAGVYALVLEMVPEELAERITDTLEIPVIGIGAGASTDGQILVLHDLLGLDREFEPRFVKRYDDLGDRAVGAVEEYCREVREGEFPTDDHSFS